MSVYKISIFSKETSGGTGTFLTQIGLLGKKKFQLNFYFYKKDKFFNFKNKYFLINKKYPSTDAPTVLKVFIFLNNLFKTYRLILAEKPALIFTADYYSFSILSLLKPFFKNVPLVCSFHVGLEKYVKDKPNRLYQRLLIWLFEHLLRKPARLVFVSNGLAGSFFKKINGSKEKSAVIYNGVDISLIQKKALERPFKKIKRLIKDKNYNIFTVGRLNKQKDYTTLLKAFKILTRKIANVNLFIVSDGELKSFLLKKTKNLGLESRVYFLGWVKNFYPYLKLTDLFVFSSFYEGFGITLIEAMACRLPVLATDTDFGPAEILEEGKYGILVPVGDDKKMADKMEKLLKNRRLKIKYSKLAYKRAKDFNLKNMLQGYERLFLDTIEKK